SRKSGQGCSRTEQMAAAAPRRAPGYRPAYSWRRDAMPHGTLGRLGGAREAPLTGRRRRDRGTPATSTTEGRRAGALAPRRTGASTYLRRGQRRPRDGPPHLRGGGRRHSALTRTVPVGGP